MLISIAMQCKNFMCSTYKKRKLVDIVKGLCTSETMIKLLLWKQQYT